MGPKLLGGGALLLAAAFVLALPSIFEGEPADGVEPIRFGPPPIARVGGATPVTGVTQVTAPAPDPLEPALPAAVPVAPAAIPVAPAAAPLVASGGGNRGGGSETNPPTAEQGAFAEDAEEGERPREDENAGGDDHEGEDWDEDEGTGEDWDMEKDGEDEDGEDEDMDEDEADD